MQAEQREGRWLPWLAILPPLFLAILVWFAAADAPFWDEWDLTLTLAEAKAGTIEASDYFDRHGVHRYVLPKFILTQVALATGWNIRIQVLVNLAIAFVGFGLIALIAAPRLGTRAGALALIGSSLAFFSLSQYDSWVWGWLVGYFLSIAMMIAAIAVLSRAPWPLGFRIGCAALLCTLATFSVGFGAVAWIALAPLVWIEARRPRLALGAWLALGVACLALYSVGPTLPVQETPGSGGPIDIGLFFLAVTGTQWTSTALPALLLGTLSIALFSWLSIRGLRISSRGAMPWISLGLLSLGFAGLAAIVRSNLGWDTAVSPRYATPMVLLTVATLQLAALTDSPRPRARLSLGLILLLVATNITFVPVFWSTASSRHVNRICVDLAFFLGPVQDACVPSSSPVPGFLEQLAFVRDAGLRPFADETWFFVPAAASSRALKVAAEPGGFALEGNSGSQLLPEPVIITSGAERERVAFVWPDREGRWKARVASEELRAEPLLEVWTIPRHQKRLVRIGKWER